MFEFTGVFNDSRFHLIKLELSLMGTISLNHRILLIPIIISFILKHAVHGVTKFNHEYHKYYLIFLKTLSIYSIKNEASMCNRSILKVNVIYLIKIFFLKHQSKTFYFYQEVLSCKTLDKIHHGLLVNIYHDKVEIILEQIKGKELPT
jgi:hypothetical protein